MEPEIAHRREEGKDQETIQSSTIPDRNTLWESDKNTRNITHKRAKRSAISQELKDSIIKDPRSTALEQSAKKSLEGLNMFNGTNLTPFVLMWVKTHRCFQHVF